MSAQVAADLRAAAEVIAALEAAANAAEADQ